MKTAIRWIAPVWGAFLVTALSGLEAFSAEEAKPAAKTPDEVTTMSPFDVQSTREKGYRATDSKTATGIALELAKTPINIQVITSDFIQDLNLDSMHETLRYTSGVMIDEFNRDASGVRMRGFQGTTFYRNGVPRSNGIYTDNLDRIEVVKGPVSAFFGQSIPGGLVNYITKTPEFKTAGDLTLTYGSFDYKRAVFDYQGVLPSYHKLAYRVIATKRDSEDWRNFEYVRRSYVSPQVRWKPNSRIDLTVGYEWTLSHENLLNNGRTNLQFHADWANPPPDVINFNRNATRPTDAAVITFLKNRWNASIANWAADIGAVRGIRPPTVTTGNLASFYPEGRKYNTGGPGADKLFRTRNIDAALRLKATEWMDVKYTYSYYWDYVDRYQPFGFPNGDRTIPYAERTNVSWNFAEVNNVDVLFTKNILGGRHRLLVGGQITDTEAKTGTRRMEYTSLQPVVHNGVTFTGRNVALNYNPFIDPQIDVRNLIKEINPIVGRNYAHIRSYYVSYQASTFKDRLNTLISVRHEGNADGTSGTVPSFGVNYEFIPGFLFFASRSENFRVNGPNITGPGVRPGELQTNLPPEEAIGTDIGIKSNWKENALVGTLSYFTLDNKNERRTDTARTMLTEPRNLDNTNTNDVQWFNIGGRERSSGLELDLAWTPVRDYETVLAYSYIWEAKIVADPSLAPGSNDARIQIGRRIGNTPVHQFKWWNKYTFAKGRWKGLALGAGVRFIGATPGATHQTIFDEYNPAYRLVDLYAGYRTKLMGRPVSAALTVENATNHIYVQGLNNTYADPRKIFLNVACGF
ncbi:MAG: TonB-dependent receptor [Verrucomicrobia bacterium]|nr:TonB-dependent receptor [Verrucomicrobiota bacterium]